MNFRTAIDFPGNPGYIDHRQQILLLGSCFAENIGLWLQQRKFNVDINPFGTLYNPLSIAQSWERIVEGKTIIENELAQLRSPFPILGVRQKGHVIAHEPPNRKDSPPSAEYRPNNHHMGNRLCIPIKRDG